MEQKLWNKNETFCIFPSIGFIDFILKNPE